MRRPGFGSGQSLSSQGSPATWLRSLLDVLEAETPVVVSPSMSGRFALPHADGDQDGISGLVAVATVRIPSYKDQVHRITAPVPAICGEDDRTVPHEQADLLVNPVEQGRKAIIPGGGHAPSMSDPSAFHRELLTFPTELPS